MTLLHLQVDWYQQELAQALTRQKPASVIAAIEAALRELQQALQQVQR